MDIEKMSKKKILKILLQQFLKKNVKIHHFTIQNREIL